MKWKRIFDGRKDEGWDAFWMSAAFPNFIFSGVCMHTFATPKVPQVDIFWWEYVPLGSVWPVLVMEETNLLLFATNLSLSHLWLMVRNSQGPGWAPDFCDTWTLWVLAPAVSRAAGQPGNFIKPLKVGFECFLRDTAGSVENFTCWTYFCTQGSEHQLFYWLWLEEEQALKQRKQFSPSLQLLLLLLPISMACFELKSSQCWDVLGSFAFPAFCQSRGHPAWVALGMGALKCLSRVQCWVCLLWWTCLGTALCLLSALCSVVL